MRAPVRLLSVALLAALSVAAAAPAAPPPHFKMLVENTSPPFSFRDDQGRPTGFVIDLINAIGADQGFVVEPDLRPWQEIYPEFTRGKGDILGLVARSEERAARMDFSAPFETMRCTFYVAATPGADAVRGPGDLRGKRIGVIQDSIVDEFARRQEWQAELVRFPSLADALAATRQGRIDATLSMQFVTDYMIRSRNLEGLVRANYFPPGLGYSLCFAVQPGNKELLARLNEGLLNVQRRGRYDWLYEKWLGPMEPRRLRWADVQLYLLPVALVALAALAGLVWQRKLLVRLSRQAREIRENEERLQLVFEGSRDGFWDWDVGAGRVLRSPQWFSLLGYAPGEIAGTSEAFHALIHPDDLPGILAHEKQIWHGEDQFTVEFRMKAKNGEWKWILDRGKVVARDPLSGLPRRIAGTHTDITARKMADEEAEKLRQKMQEAQKLESLGVLAGGIAHDFNNLLTVILGNSSLARLELAGSPVNQARLDSVVTSANRAAELCRQLLAYAGKGSYHLERVNLNELITETTRLLELSINKQAGLEFALAPTLPKIEADPSQIRQVIMNLVINASEAVAGRDGTIRVATVVIALPLAGGPAALRELPAGDYVCVEVTDTGCGMTPEVTARIFDPFFSTKFTGRGLGLAAVQGIVRTHRGALTVESTPGAGSTFKVYLPVSQARTAHPFAADSAAGA
ncbi:MAG TPA: transporter substrate-binding domain-containing protein [Lacunisphaera sp.]|nr:transporter substrate-binding domain-containing protein [Lacunisphaera sp.]